MKTVACLLLLIAVIGCSSTKQRANLLDLKIGIHHLSYSVPLVRLEKLKAERKVAFVEGDWVAKGHLRKNVPAALSPRYAVTADSSAVPSGYFDDISRMFLRLDTARDLSSIRIGEELRDHLSRLPDKYCIVVSLTGFCRAGGSVAFETLKSVLIGIFTLGLKVTVPEKAKSEMAVAIVDKEEWWVIYFDKNSVEGNPDDPEVVRAQLKKTFKAFLK
jgi:hypothetical protein